MIAWHCCGCHAAPLVYVARRCLLVAHAPSSHSPECARLHDAHVRRVHTDNACPPQFGEFLQRFGPVSVCLKKAEGFVESDSGRPQRWYHGRIGRGDAEALLKAAGAGAFLVRLSESQPDKLAAQYLTIKDGKPAIKNNLVYNAGEVRGVVRRLWLWLVSCGSLIVRGARPLTPALPCLRAPYWCPRWQKGFALTAGLDRCFASIADLLSAQATAGRMTVAAVSALHTSYVPTGSSGSGGDPYAAFDPSAAGAGSTSAGPGGSSGGADPYASFDPTAAGAGSGSGTGRAAPGSDPYASFDPSMAGGGAPGGTAAAPSADPCTLARYAVSELRVVARVPVGPCSLEWNVTDCCAYPSFCALVSQCARCQTPLSIPLRPARVAVLAQRPLRAAPMPCSIPVLRLASEQLPVDMRDGGARRRGATLSRRNTLTSAPAVDLSLAKQPVSACVTLERLLHRCQQQHRP